MRKGANRPFLRNIIRKPLTALYLPPDTHPSLRRKPPGSTGGGNRASRHTVCESVSHDVVVPAELALSIRTLASL